MILTRDDAFTVVCNIRTPIDANHVKVGTGTFITNEKGVFLLTAEHVSRETNNNTMLVFGLKDMSCIQLKLSDIAPSMNWKTHPVADMAVLELQIRRYSMFFQGRCYPVDHINLTQKCASRDDEITVIGFPSGLGVQGKFSPLTFRSHLASGYLTLNRADRINQFQDFFCLENPSMGGYSGGPVLDLGYSVWGMATSTKERTILHGIVHGTMKDDTGGKIALITPMFYLSDLL